jgi:hypothetical protein
MDVGQLLDSSPLSIQCRQCGLAETDDYESVEENRIQSMRCAGCGTVTHFAVIECPGCGAETLLVLAGLETEPAFICAACERHHVDEAAVTPSRA